MPNSPFTPEQISQILEEFFKTVGTRQYIGARYVPIFGRKGEDSIQWDNTKPYEPLTIVLYQGDSYTSRQYVPAGVDITNELFWALTGNYNAQIEAYRREVQGFDARITETERQVTQLGDDFQTLDVNLHADFQALDASLHTDLQTLDDSLHADINSLSDVNVQHLHPLGQFDRYSESYKIMQGGCMIGDEALIAFIKVTEDGSAELNMVNPQTGAISEKHVVSGCGHFQSLAYDEAENRLYIAGYSDTYVHIVNASTFNVVGRINTNTTIAGVTIGNGKLYCVNSVAAQQPTVIVYDLADTTSPIATFMLERTMFSTQRGIIDVNFNNDALCVMYVNGIARYSANNGTFINLSEFSTNIDNTYSLSEVEFFTYVNDRDYILGFMVYGSMTSGGLTVAYSALCEYVDSNNCVSPLGVATSGWRGLTRMCHVDSRVSLYQCDGTEERPFTSIHQAINALVGCEYVIGSIQIHQNRTDEPLYIAGSKTKQIGVYGVGDYIPTFAGICVRDSVYLNTGHIKLNKGDFSSYFPLATDVYYAIANHSEVVVTNIAIGDYLDGASGIYVDRTSKLHVMELNHINGPAFHNLGYIKSGFRRVLTVDGTINQFGEVHGIGFDSATELPANSVTFKIPNNGVNAVITCGSVYVLMPIVMAAINQRMTVGDLTFTVATSNMNQEGATITLSVTGGQINYLHLLVE